jgi:deoxyribonuclease-4
MARRPLPLIGAQISTAGGLAPVPQRALDIGAEVVQIFDTNPRTWRPRPASEEELGAFTTGLARRRLPLYLHTIYLINLASPDDALRRRSGAALAHALRLGAQTGAAGVVTHVGSHRGEGFDKARRWVAETVAAAMAWAAGVGEEPPAPQPGSDAPGSRAAGGDKRGADGLSGGPGGGPSGGLTGGITGGLGEVAGLSLALPPLLLENGAGSGNTVGDSLSELAALVETLAEVLPSPAAVGLCLDTAHLFAAGYPVHQPEGLEDLVGELRALDLLDRVKLVHLNDSKAPFAGHRDRHDDLGKGQMGYEALARVVRHPGLAHIPFVLEVPGADGRGPDSANVRVAKRMRAGAPPPRPAPAPAGMRRVRPG